MFFFNYLFGQVGLYHQNLLQSISSVFFKIDVNSAHVYFFFLYEFTISGSLDQNLFQRYFRQGKPDAPPNPEQLWQ